MKSELEPAPPQPPQIRRRRIKREPVTPSDDIPKIKENVNFFEKVVMDVLGNQHELDAGEQFETLKSLVDQSEFTEEDGEDNVDGEKK